MTKSIFEMFMMWWMFCYMAHLLHENEAVRLGYITHKAFDPPLLTNDTIIQRYGKMRCNITEVKVELLLEDFFIARPRGSIWQQFTRSPCGDAHGCYTATADGHTWGDDFFYHKLFDEELIVNLTNISFDDIRLAVLIGGLEGEGAPPHKHVASHNLLLSGKKMWTFGNGTTFVQEPGDVVHVPAGMVHETYNIYDGWAVFIS
jgi:mannose-6-phosphate isomerase-like protein (cupin superfamily)